MDSRFIQIADQGSFDGKVTIDVAEIRGRFSGELTARDHLIVHSTGRVFGKIRYGKIVVHEGGEVSGDIKSLNSAEPASTTKPADAAKADEPGVPAMSLLLAKTA
jgi:cytoskeletal protein CcmA (bactofilin family)